MILIAPLQVDVLILTSDGAMYRLDPRTLRIKIDDRRFSPSCAAAMLPWVSGEQRIVLATEKGSVKCVGFDDSVVVEYAARRRFRMLSAAVDIVAAVTEDRQRIIVWESWDGRALSQRFTSVVRRGTESPMSSSRRAATKQIERQQDTSRIMSAISRNSRAISRGCFAVTSGRSSRTCSAYTGCHAAQTVRIPAARPARISAGTSPTKMQSLEAI